MRAAPASIVIVIAVGLLAGGCKGKSGLSAAKSSAGGASGGYHLLVETGRPDAECVSSVVSNTTFDYELAQEVAGLCKGFTSPGVILSLDNEDLVYALQEQIESQCSLTTKVVEGKIEWRLRVSEAGTSTDCMTSVLTKMMPNTQSSDWEQRVSSGQVVHSDDNYRAITKLQKRLEHKCGCKLEKEAVY